MKKYRILNVLTNTMKKTNQRILIFELSEIKVVDWLFDKTHYTFGKRDLICVINQSSSLAQELLLKANNEDVISIDEKEFRIIIENYDGEREKIYYHKNVFLPGID